MLAGWVDATAYYQRVYLDGSGRVELRAYEVRQGTDRGVVWSADADEAGPFAAGVSEARIGPTGERIAFLANGQLYVASSGDPGASAVPLSVDGIVGFAWSPAGDRLVASDGAGLTLFDAGGAVLGDVSLDAEVGAPIWREDGLYVPLLDGSETLVRLDEGLFA